MPDLLKTILKYLFTFTIGIFLLWYLINEQSPVGKQNIIKAFLNADYTWLAITVIISLIEKMIRAYRWNLLMEPLSYTPPLKNTFIAVMVAYFANIFAPRMGEVARCGILKKTDNVPVNTSLGTVVAERAVDFFCLLLVIPFALLLEYKEISEILQRMIFRINNSIANTFWILIFISGILTAIAIALFIFRASIKQNKVFIKITEFLSGIWISVLSIKKLNKKGQFIFCTFMIWVCYFFMTYLAFFCLEATSKLNLSAGLVILVAGGLGMAAPVQAGIGAFHAIVEETLIIVYKVSSDWALPFAFLIWGSQVLTAFLVGLICLIFAFGFLKKEKNKPKNVNV